MNYEKLLNDGFAFRCHSPEKPESKISYLAGDLFDFTTYDGEVNELFGKKAIEVCEAITKKTTFEYIKNEENYIWYLLICNMPFFKDRIEWGSSIRGAWWNSEQTLDSSCLWSDDYQVTDDLILNATEWDCFIRAVIEFAREDVQA